VPFQITVQVCDRTIPNTVIDEGASINILSTNAWQAFGSPQFVPVTWNLLTFDIRAILPLGILPQFSVTLGGKMVYVDVMVVHEPLDFNLLLRRDYVYAIRYFVSTLFQVMCFPHNGNIVTIDQLSFIEPHLMFNHSPSLNGPYMPMMFSPPQVSYVTTRRMPLVVDEDEPLIVSSISLDLDPVVDMVISSKRILDPYLPTLIEVADMYSFQSVFLSSNEDLLEAMADVCPLTCIPSKALSS
jgi:hypothetical protein